MAPIRMVPLVTASSPFEAKVLAARLGAEGIVWEFRGGGVDAVYPLGATEVLVDAEQSERARELLLADLSLANEAESAVDDGAPASPTTADRLSVVLVGLLLAGFVAVRILSLT